MAAQQIASVSSYKNPKLAGINEVEISKSGKYKYILIKVHDPDKDREFKFIVRGNSKCSYHVDIYDMVVEEIEGQGLDCEVMGGGRIEHEPNKKCMKIFGYSQVHGSWLKQRGGKTALFDIREYQKNEDDHIFLNSWQSCHLHETQLLQ